MPGPTVRSEGEEPSERPTADSPARAESAALRALEAVPPLALMAVVAALFELALARVGWHGLADLVDPETLRELRRLARFPRTLAAVSGTVALTAALVGFLRLPGFAPIGRRLVVAAFSGVFVPAIVVATVLPAASLRRRLVIFGLAAANVLVTLLGMSALRYRPGRGLFLGALAATLTCFLSLTVVGLGQLAQSEDSGGVFAPLSVLFVAHPTATQDLLMGLRHVAEVAWLLAPAAAAWTVVSHGGSDRARARLAWLLGLALVWAGAIVAFQELVGHRYRLVLFGAFRLGLFADDLPVLYAAPVGMTLAGALLGLARRAPALRQLGVGMLLWLAAGFAPHTPIQLLYMVLGIMLMSRAAQALDRTGAWQTHQPWARFRARAAPSP